MCSICVNLRTVVSAFAAFFDQSQKEKDLKLMRKLSRNFFILLSWVKKKTVKLQTLKSHMFYCLKCWRYSILKTWLTSINTNKRFGMCFDKHSFTYSFPVLSETIYVNQLYNFVFIYSGSFQTIKYHRSKSGHSLNTMPLLGTYLR